MTVRGLGGGPFGQQPGMTGGAGLNNIGLLVRLTGSYSYIGPDTFLLDDGSGRPVLCLVPSGVVLSPAWRFVTVTGISSCTDNGNEVASIVRVRGQADIDPIL